VAVYANRNRLGSGVGKQAMRWRAEIVERSFAHNLDRGGMRRTWLRGRENVHKRYLVHIAGHNLGIMMRLLIGAGTPREATARAPAYLFFVYAEDAVGDLPCRRVPRRPGDRERLGAATLQLPEPAKPREARPFPARVR
jgi:hypothetical protein